MNVKEMLDKLEGLEMELDEKEMMADHWLDDEEECNIELAEIYEAEADVLYREIYELFGLIAEKIVVVTGGEVNEVKARAMVMNKREDVKRIFSKYFEEVL